MTGIVGLTPEQERFATHNGAAFVHACPGSGKTRTIIARIFKLQQHCPPRRGVAVVSFTNSAVDEFRERCHAAGLQGLLAYPSFMGTLDAFVRHFVVLPCCPTTTVQRPIIVDSWDSLGIEIRLAGRAAFRGDGVSLDLFDPETNVIDAARIGHTALRNHVTQHRASYQQTAALRRRGLLRAGYLSASDVRAQTLQIINDPVRGSAIGRALAARFREVIVDEGQDCNPLDLRILGWLRECGLHVTFVCDPHQAIYEFRHGTPVDIQEFRDTYAVQTRLNMTGNFRSSPAICQLAASLRQGGRPDRSVGGTAGVEHPVMLIAYRGRAPTADIGRSFLARLAELGLVPSSAILLAHSGKIAQRAATSVALGASNGSSRIETMARNVGEFWSPAATGRSRELVVRSVESLLLDLMGQRENGEHLLRALERAGIDRRTHRRRALSLLMNIPKTCADDDGERLAWISDVHTEVARLNLPLPTGATIRGFFRRPSNGHWSRHLQAAIKLELSSGKIHEVKGREYDAVCVVIPPDRAPQNRSEALMTSWESRTDTEAKRVIYVGVTRAKSFIAIAVPTVFADRCAGLLRADQVPHTRSDL